MGSKAGGDECHLAASNADAQSWNTSGCVGISTAFYKHVGGGGVRDDRVQWRLHSLSWLDSFTAKPPPDIILTCAPRSLSLMAKVAPTPYNPKPLITPLVP